MAVEHREHDSGHLELRVHALADELNRLQQLGYALKRQKVRLHRNDDFGGDRQRVDCEQTQARRAVEEKEVELVVLRRFDAVLEDHLAADLGHELDLGGGQIDAAGD